MIEAINKNYSIISIILTNILAIILALVEGWNLMMVLLVYVGQSAVIGVFNFIRILSIKEFSYQVMINGKPTGSPQLVKFFTAFFFLCHYSGFLIGYTGFIIIGLIGSMLFKVYETSPITLLSIIFAIIAISAFFINHLISFIIHKEELEEKQSIGKLLFYPYIRILPMHIIILLGGFLFQGTLMLVIFMILKTIADVLMHMVEHKDFKQAQVN